MGFHFVSSGQEFTDVTFNNICDHATNNDINSTVFASQLITASCAAAFYLVMFFLGILGVWFQPCLRVSSSQGALFAFFVGALITCINVFTNADDLLVKLSFRLFTTILIGIIFIIFGAWRFFEMPNRARGEANPQGNDRPPLGKQQPSMGLVVSLLTFPLVIIEIVLICASFSTKITDETKGSLTDEKWHLVNADKTVFLIQKIFQVVIYLYLRNTTISQGYEENVRFYFRLLSFFNFIEWIDPQKNIDNDVALTGIREESDGWFNLLTVLYKALIIDYRLLCALLFLEHSVEIQNHADPADENDNGGGNQEMSPCDEVKRAFGFALGSFCLVAPVFGALYFEPAFDLKAGVNMFAITVNIVVVVCGICLLYFNNLGTVPIHLRESQGVKIMVCCLGAVGFTCWFVEAVIACFWAAKGKHRGDIRNLPRPYIIPWTAAKFIIRSITTAFLIFLFTNINARALPVLNQSTKNYVLVPAVMLGVLSMFGEGLVDQKFGPVDHLLRCEIKDQGLEILFNVGPPMHLGFLLHVFLYFIIIQTRLRNCPPQQEQEPVNPGQRDGPIRGRGRGWGRGWGPQLEPGPFQGRGRGRGRGRGWRNT